jgi:membrane protease YdiL (CAAX protease family)
MTDQHGADPLESLTDERSFVERNSINPLVFAIVALGIVFVLYQLVGGTLTVLLVGQPMVTRENAFTMRLFTMVGQLLFIFLPSLVFARMLSRRLADVFTWRVPSVRETLYASLGLLWLQQIFQIYLFFQERLPLPDAVKQILDPLKRMMEEMFRNLVTAHSIPELLFVVLVVAIVPSIVEELLFRGVIQHSIARVFTPLRSAFITGVIFGLFHFHPFALLPLIGLGWYFGFLRVRSNSIIMAMTAHFLNNALAVIVTYFGMTEENILSLGSEREPATGTVLIQLILYLLLFALSLTAYLRATEDRPSHERREP